MVFGKAFALAPLAEVPVSTCNFQALLMQADEFSDGCSEHTQTDHQQIRGIREQLFLLDFF